jgi:hypothetical protein
MKNKHTNESKTVYVINDRVDEPPVVKAEISDISSLHTFVTRKYRTKFGHGSTTTRVNATFSPAETGELASDLLPSGDGESAEMLFDPAMNEVLSDPDKSRELYLRMGTEALVKEMSGVQQFEGKLRTPDQVLRDSDFAITDLYRGVSTGEYRSGTRSNVVLDQISADFSLPDTPETRMFLEKVQSNGREALDLIYEKWGVDYAKAYLLERRAVDGVPGVTRIAVYPTKDGVIHFKEVTFIEDTPSTPFANLQPPHVDIIVGVQDYQKNGFEPVI